MNTIAKIAVAVLLSASSFASAGAAQTPALSECISLSDNYKATRVGGNEQLLLKDGDAHYRVRFNGYCSAIAQSSSLQVDTDGTRNQLCPQGSWIRTKHDRCKVRSIETIDAEDFESQARRNR